MSLKLLKEAYTWLASQVRECFLQAEAVCTRHQLHCRSPGQGGFLPTLQGNLEHLQSERSPETWVCDAQSFQFREICALQSRDAQHRKSIQASLKTKNTEIWSLLVAIILDKSYLLWGAVYGCVYHYDPAHGGNQTQGLMHGRWVLLTEEAPRTPGQKGSWPLKEQRESRAAPSRGTRVWLDRLQNRWPQTCFFKFT